MVSLKPIIALLPHLFSIMLKTFVSCLEVHVSMVRFPSVMSRCMHLGHLPSHAENFVLITFTYCLIHLFCRINLQGGVLTHFTDEGRERVRSLLSRPT